VIGGGHGWVLLLAAILVGASCGGDHTDDRATHVVREVRFPSRSDVFAGRSSYLLVQRDVADEVISDPSDDVHPRLVELDARAGGLVERSLPRFSEPDLSEPSALQLPGDDWLIAGVPCPADPDTLTAVCDHTNVAPFVRRFDERDGTWADVGHIPNELRGRSLELVGVDGEVVVVRALERDVDRPPWSYWTLDVGDGTYRQLWRTDRPASVRFDCVTRGHLVVVDETETITHRIALVDIGDRRAHDDKALPTESEPIVKLVCDDDGATVVETDGTTPVAVAIDAAGRPGASHRGPEVPSGFGGTSDRSTVVLVSQASGGASRTTVEEINRRGTSSVATVPPTPTTPETLRFAIFHGGTWKTAMIANDAVDFVHPGVTGDQVLLEHRDDRWSLAAIG